MTSDDESEFRLIERLWRERFGEPPPIRVDLGLALSILDQAAAPAVEPGFSPRPDEAAAR